MRIELCVLLAACGRIGIDPVADGGGGGTTTCWPAWKSGAVALAPPAPIAELAAAAQRTNASLAAGDTALYFDDNSSGTRDIWLAVRPDTSSPWGNAAPVSALDTTSDEGRITVDGSGSFAIFPSARGGSPQLWFATGAGTTFEVPSQAYVGNINGTGMAVSDPEMLASGLVLYAALSTLTGQEIASAERPTATSDFGAPVVQAELSISASVADPTLSTDEDVIVFTSGAPASMRDLYYAVRASPAQPFGAAQPVPEVNTSGFEDSDGELSADGCTLYFTSDRGGHPQLFSTTVVGP